MAAATAEAVEMATVVAETKEVAAAAAQVDLEATTEAGEMAAANS